MNAPTPNPLPPLPARPDDGHKGTFGTVIVVGGCTAMLGAPALTARAALRIGTGLVKLACPASILPHVLTIEPSATGIALPPDTALQTANPDHQADADATRQCINTQDPQQRAVLAIGPGMGSSSLIAPRVQTLLATHRPTVLDADALNALAQQQQPLQRSAPTVLTPHPGEFRRLAQAAPLNINDPTDPPQRLAAAAALAQYHSSIVLLKGQHTVVSDGIRNYTNPTGNPAMATAGSGDVLTGVIAGLIAQGMDAFDAACWGAYLHGAAGDAWAALHGCAGLRAQELADALPGVMHRLRTDGLQ